MNNFFGTLCPCTQILVANKNILGTSVGQSTRSEVKASECSRAQTSPWVRQMSTWLPGRFSRTHPASGRTLHFFLGGSLFFSGGLKSGGTFFWPSERSHTSGACMYGAIDLALALGTASVVQFRPLVPCCSVGCAEKNDIDPRPGWLRFLFGSLSKWAVGKSTPLRMVFSSLVRARRDICSLFSPNRKYKAYLFLDSQTIWSLHDP